jgi:hypothetical protein
MVLRVKHAGRWLRLYGDGRLDIQAGEDESYTRRLDRSRMLEIFRAAVDHGLAEYDLQLLFLEIGGEACAFLAGLKRSGRFGNRRDGIGARDS